MCKILLSLIVCCPGLLYMYAIIQDIELRKIVQVFVNLTSLLLFGKNDGIVKSIVGSRIVANSWCRVVYKANINFT